MTACGSSLTLNNSVFKAFVTYAAIVLVKTLLMSIMTSIQRFRYRSFVNPEDARTMKGKDGRRLKEEINNPHVERVRRCHLNDLENVLPFVLVGLLYCSTSPDEFTALLHFRIFTAARLLHMVAYLVPLPQPSRALGFFVGYVTTFSMAFRAAIAVDFAL